jgi:RHS repeat-associated protein
MAQFGLMFFNARWLDPALGRFAQTDTLIPEASQGVQAWDRYAFVNNNPVRYNDPTGHFAFLPVLIAAAIGAAVSATANAYIQYQASGTVDISDVISAGAGGAVAGAVLAIAAPTSLIGAAIAGGTANVLANQVTAAVDAALSPSNEGFWSDFADSGGLFNGSELTNTAEIVEDFVFGAAVNATFSGIAVSASKYTYLVANPLGKSTSVPMQVQLLPRNNLTGTPGYLFPVTKHYYLAAQQGVQGGILGLGSDLLEELIIQCLDSREICMN